MLAQTLTTRRSLAYRLRCASAAAAVLVGGALLLGASPAQAEGPVFKFAVIDMRRAISETEQGLRVQATLKKIYETRQVEIEAKSRQAQEDKAALEKDMQAPPAKRDEAALRKKYERLMQLGADIEKAELQRQREMQQKEAEMTAPIYSGIVEAVKRIAATEGYEMVLEKSVVPYFRSDLEVTDRAIQMYNGGQVSPGKGPAPTPPAGKGGAAPAPSPAPAKPASPAPKK